MNQSVLIHETCYCSVQAAMPIIAANRYLSRTRAPKKPHSSHRPSITVLFNKDVKRPENSGGSAENACNYA